MSNITKISQEIRNYVINRKKRNSELSVRFLAGETSTKFNMRVGKSSINNILKSLNLSSLVGRKVTKIFHPSGEASGVGFGLILGANFLLGLSKILANSVMIFDKNLKLKKGTLEAISEAWIMSKAVYNVGLEKIENYTKDDLWFIIGRRINKGMLKQYAGSLKLIQPINLHILSELTHSLQDVLYYKFILTDGSNIFIDGQQKSIWKDSNIPLDFSITLGIAYSYINSILGRDGTFSVISARPDTVLGDEFSDFIFSIEGSSANKRIRKIELVSPKGEVVKDIPFVSPEKRKFMVGIWPWQYKLIGELEKHKPSSKHYLEHSGAELYLTEGQVRFAQHVRNIEVTLKLIVIKTKETGPAKIGILTNISDDEKSTKEVVAEYVRKCPDFEAGHRLFLNAVKNPLYFEDFLSSQKILSLAEKLKEDKDPDSLFGTLVDVLNSFAKRSFLAPECYNWSLIKTRELFYKKNGIIKRDMSDDVVFNMLKTDDLQQMQMLNYASTKFNESPIFDESGKKVWFITPAWPML